MILMILKSGKLKLWLRRRQPESLGDDRHGRNRQQKRKDILSRHEKSRNSQTENGQHRGLAQVL
jgi:hypothetical protein